MFNSPTLFYYLIKENNYVPNNLSAGYNKFDN